MPGRTAGDEPIAIVGIGCRFPGGGSDPEAFWQIHRATLVNVNAIEGVNHNYEREHRYNLWFVVTAASEGRLQATLGAIVIVAVLALEGRRVAICHGVYPRLC